MSRVAIFHEGPMISAPRVVAECAKGSIYFDHAGDNVKVTVWTKGVDLTGEVLRLELSSSRLRNLSNWLKSFAGDEK